MTCEFTSSQEECVVYSFKSSIVLLKSLETKDQSSHSGPALSCSVFIADMFMLPRWLQKLKTKFLEENVKFFQLSAL